MLFAMGAGPRVIAVSSFDHYPHPVEMLPRVGALLDPDIERIITLRPDLVVLFEGQVELREKLAQAGIRVFVYPRPTLADIVTTLRSLGRQVGLGEQADREADAIERQLDAVRQKVKGLPPPRTMLVIGREPGTLRNIFVSGGLGFLSDALTIAGGASVFGSVRRENLQVTTEAILASQPDVIVEVVASQPWSAADIERETHVWDTLSSLPAVRNHRVYLLMGDEFVTPGPRIVQTAREMAEVLHGATRGRVHPRGGQVSGLTPTNRH
jgi:iron complex transport system substrate-binding protein